MQKTINKKNLTKEQLERFFNIELRDLVRTNKVNTCLLYTSDAADERSSVDLGGRRIIKKKNNKKILGAASRHTHKTARLAYILVARGQRRGLVSTRQDR